MTRPNFTAGIHPVFYRQAFGVLKPHREFILSARYFPEKDGKKKKDLPRPVFRNTIVYYTIRAYKFKECQKRSVSTVLYITPLPKNTPESTKTPRNKKRESGISGTERKNSSIKKMKK